MKLAVCVPCHTSHVRYIPELLESIDQQTVLPTIVSISISQWTEEPPVFVCRVPVEVCCSPDVLPAANNRNIAADAVIQRVDALSFIDADDRMHPRRIEYVLQELRQHSVVYHSYRVWNAGSPIPECNTNGNVCRGVWKEIRTINPDLTARLLFMIRLGIGMVPFPVHAAHVSVRSDVFQKVHFPIGRNRSDDSEYMLTLYRSGYSISVLHDPLTYFRMGATTLGSATK